MTRRAAVLAVVAVAATVLAPAGSPAAGAADTLPQFRSVVRAIGPELADRMTPSSWRPGCPVPLRDLRLVRVSFVHFDGSAGYGRLVVHEDHATHVVAAFRSLYDQRFPIRRMRLVDAYDGNDARSMAADNTSAFNCRKVGDGSRWSEHAYGAAVDVNPVQNPYVSGSTVEPPAGAAYIDRSPLRRGMVTRGVRTAFAAIGWEWGGGWSGAKDYQHFSSTGR